MPLPIIAKEVLLKQLCEEVILRGNSLRVRVFGGSMQPFIKDGSIITINPADIGELMIGDVVFYKFGRQFIAHRVLKKYDVSGQTHLVTRGDSLPYPDQRPVCPEQVLGRVVNVETDEYKRNLNKGFYRLMGVLWAKTSPHSQAVYLSLWKIKHRVGQTQWIQRLRKRTSSSSVSPLQ